MHGMVCFADINELYVFLLRSVSFVTCESDQCNRIHIQYKPLSNLYNTAPDLIGFLALKSGRIDIKIHIFM